MLVHPHQNAPTCITTDASNRAVGGVLEQFIDGQWKPISSFSKKLCQAELNYSAFDTEILAIYLAIRHFQYFVEGRKFTTDIRYIEVPANNVANALSRDIQALN